MFKIEWYTADSETCYMSKLSRHIISAISTGFMMMLKRDKFIKFIIFDKDNNNVFSASRDCSSYNIEDIKNLT